MKELNALRFQGYKDYFETYQNYIDASNFVVFYLYYFLRITLKD